MTISVMDEDGWGECVDGYQWSDSGGELLVQLTESLRVYAVNGAVTERSVIPVELGEVMGIGSAAGAWWLMTKQGDIVAYRQGLEECDLPLKGAVASETSLPTVSPDGRIIACVVGKREIVFWSTSDGTRLFEISVEGQGSDDELLGQAGIESLSWSPDSRNLAIRPDFPMGDLMIVNVSERQVLGGDI